MKYTYNLGDIVLVKSEKTGKKSIQKINIVSSKNRCLYPNEEHNDENDEVWYSSYNGDLFLDKAKYFAEREVVCKASAKDVIYCMTPNEFMNIKNIYMQDGSEKAIEEIKHFVYDDEALATYTLDEIRNMTNDKPTTSQQSDKQTYTFKIFSNPEKIIVRELTQEQADLVKDIFDEINQDIYYRFTC